MISYIDLAANFDAHTTTTDSATNVQWRAGKFVKKDAVTKKEDARFADAAASGARAKGDGDRISASDRVADSILQDIRNGRLVPGQHLLEPELTSRLGISRGSLREALKHLAAAGIVTLSRFRGAYIATLDLKSVLDLLDTLEPLARLAARLAAQNSRGEKACKPLLESARMLSGLHTSAGRGDYLNERRRFYDIMIEMGGNTELARAMPLSRTDLFRAQVETRQSELQRRRHADGYIRIAQAIADRDPAAAEKAVVDHFEGTRNTMRELSSDVFPPNPA